MDLISMMVFLILVGLVFWVIRYLSGAFGIPAPITAVLYVVLVVYCVVYLLGALGLSSGPVLRLR